LKEISQSPNFSFSKLPATLSPNFFTAKFVCLISFNILMSKLLVLFAHPALEKSRVHARMIRRIQRLDGLTFHDLYEIYPDFDIDVKKEQELLLKHDVIILQHPFYWYSGPAMIKQWQDLVLEHGWAYGKNGNMLAGKKMFNAISSGGSRDTYAVAGGNRFTIPQLLAPFEQTVTLCKMQYLPPFVLHSTHRITNADLDLKAVQYEQLLTALINDLVTESEWKNVTYLNELFPIPETSQS
jgi:glutathione-regulated potassium-efflux system ancillary protein KefG